MSGMQVEIDQSQEQRGDDRAKYTAGETSEMRDIGAVLSTTLWELLAIGSVGIATYLLVSLIVWITSLL